MTTTKMQALALVLALLALLLTGTPVAHAAFLTPFDANGIRQFPTGQRFLLDFLSVSRSPGPAPLEDRAFIIYDLRGFPGSVPGASLELAVQNLDPGGAVGVIDVSVYVPPPDGMVRVDQFNDGTLLTSFAANLALQRHEVDVTDQVNLALSRSQPFIGFRLSTTTADRYFLGPPFTSDPVLNVIPEPSALILAGTGAVALLGFRYRRRRAAGGGPTAGG